MDRIRKLVLIMALVAAPDATAAQILSEGEADLSHVVATRNVDYMEMVEYPDQRDRLDVFMPEDARSSPVVVFFHGGALTQGTKLDGEALAARLVSAEVGVVSANYRLSPGVMHPSHVEDAAAAYAWVINNIERFGGDPGQVYVSGHSAGGYLAALLAMDEAYLARHGLRPTVIRGAILISPFLYVEETARDRPKDVWGTNPADWLEASVTPHIGPGKRPLLLIYADGDADWRKDQNERFARAMREAGNPSTWVLQVAGRDHISLLASMDEPDDQIGDAVLDFIGKRPED